MKRILCLTMVLLPLILISQNSESYFPVEIGKEKIKYYADYKHFKDGRQQIDKSDIQFEINELIDGKEKYGQPLFIPNAKK